ncbi:thioredoxin-like fold domain-containing protein MRL7 homolog, chloroplastic [Typha latifolia]|uniref:thioredoxin-like fold domain-containing protein MRL7 homolog, chloroplastic n=1 Tax=Typha latifolia TaxID=4733 RepID=UPI003C2C8B9B
MLHQTHLPKPSFSFSFSFLFLNPNPNPYPRSPILSSSARNYAFRLKPPRPFAAASSTSDPNTPNPKPNPPKPKGPRPKPKPFTEVASSDGFLSTIPRKRRRGRRSEATAVEDFVRDRLQETFASIKEKDAGVLEGKEEALRPAAEEVEGEEEEAEVEEVVEEEDPDWPLDADVGWGIRASEYFEKHPIKNVVADGVEIDWEGEMEEGWVKEINCLEWESFAFHPSPLVVLVFERYRRASHNWKLLKELEKAAKVYWSARDRLPPRTVKVDINIERDLAYALKVKECPQLLFLKGNKIIYREKEMRTADELVQMIAHFYYNAKRPLWVDAAAIAPPF